MQVDNQLMRAANLRSCPNWHSLIILMLDEMHIKEELVYDKHNGRMVGFVNLGNINNHFLAYERSVESKNEKMKIVHLN